MENNITGIYAIRNLVNGKLYIGSSKSVHDRWKHNHLQMLRNKTHYNRHLQASWNKHGESSFIFEVLEECSEGDLVLSEGKWIEEKKSWDRQFGYNFSRIIDGKTIYVDGTKIIMSRAASRDEGFWQTGVNKQILDLYAQGMSKNGIAKQLQVCRNAVYSCLEHNGLHKSTGKGRVVKLTDAVKKDILDYRDQGLSWQEIVEKTGVSKTQLYRSLKFKDGKYGGGIKSKRDTYITYTPDKEREAIKLRGQGKTWKEIGRKLGISVYGFYHSGIAKRYQDMVRKKVTLDMVQRAVELRNQGITWDNIAKITGSSATTLKKYCLCPNLANLL